MGATARASTCSKPRLILPRDSENWSTTASVHTSVQTAAICAAAAARERVCAPSQRVRPVQGGSGQCLRCVGKQKILTTARRGPRRAIHTFSDARPKSSAALRLVLVLGVHFPWATARTRLCGGGEGTHLGVVGVRAQPRRLRGGHSRASELYRTCVATGAAP